MGILTSKSWVWNHSLTILPGSCAGKVVARSKREFKKREVFAESQVSWIRESFPWN